MSGADAAPLRVLVVGASGLVGRECVDRLRAAPRVAETIALLRRPPSAAMHAASVRTVQVDFEALLDPATPIDTDADVAFAVDAAICALGTTIRRAGSQAAFRRVDFDYALAVARRVRAAGATSFGVVSAVGADPQARVFYNRVKGELEVALGALGFASLTIARPSLLTGARTEWRWGERLALPFAGLAPARYKPVSARAVATALVDAVLAATPGIRVLDNVCLRQAAR